MGRTVPSFRLALAEEESNWKEYRNHLDASERIDFDEMFAIPRLYTSACSASVKLVRVCPIFMSILLRHYIDLKKISKELGIEEQQVCR